MPLVDKSNQIFYLKKHYLFLSQVEGISKGLDWATMPLLLFWIPISFVTLSQPVLIALLVVTAISTLAVLIYTAVTAYQDDKNNLSKLETSNEEENPLEVPQKNELSIKKDFLLSMITTTTTLFSFFWVGYDALVTLEILADISMPLLPLIGIPACMVVSVLFGYLHYSKLKQENELYQAIISDKKNSKLNDKPLQFKSEGQNKMTKNKGFFPKFSKYPKKSSESLDNIYKDQRLVIKRRASQ